MIDPLSITSSIGLTLPSAQHRLSIFSDARHLTSSICRFARRSPPLSVIVRTTDTELRLVAALRRAAERGEPLPSIAVADALLDERRELAELGNQFVRVRV